MLKYAALATTLIGGVRALVTSSDLDTGGFSIGDVKKKVSGGTGSQYVKYYKVQAHVEIESGGDHGFQLEYCTNQGAAGSPCDTTDNPDNYYDQGSGFPYTTALTDGVAGEDAANLALACDSPCGTSCEAASNSNNPPSCTPPPPSTCDTTGCTKPELQAAYKKATESSGECHGDDTGSHVDPVRADCDTSDCDPATLYAAHLAACAPPSALYTRVDAITCLEHDSTADCTCAGQGYSILNEAECKNATSSLNSDGSDNPFFADLQPDANPYIGTYGWKDSDSMKTWAPKGCIQVHSDMKIHDGNPPTYDVGSATNNKGYYSDLDPDVPQDCIFDPNNGYHCVCKY